MVKRSFYIFLLTALPCAVFAQTNYQPGYILKNNGDTLKGYIDYREWTRSPLLVDFKANKEDKQSLRFSPAMLREFRIMGMETYISYRGPVSMNLTHIPDIPTHLDTTTKQDTVFLQQIATGKYLTLYSQEDTRKPRFFIAATNSDPVELKYSPYYNGANEIVYSDTYKGQLAYYAEKSPGNENLISRIKRIFYEKSDLKSVVNKINNNVGEDKKESPLRFFAGLAITGTSVENGIITSIRTVKTQTLVSPKINLGFDIFNNPNTRQLVFRAELSFSYINPKFNYTEPVNFNDHGETYILKSYSFNQYTASLTPQVLYNIYNKENFKVYIDAGIGLNLSAYSNDNLIIENTNNTPATLNQPFDAQHLWLNLPFQAGVVLNKKIEIAFTFIKYAEYIDTGSFAVANVLASLGVKYLFGK